MPWLPAVGGAALALLLLTLPVLFIAKIPLPYQVKRLQITLGAAALMVYGVLYGWMFGEPVMPPIAFVMGASLAGGLVEIGLAVRSARRDGLSFAQVSGWLLPVLGIVLFVMVLAMFGRAIAHV